MPRSIEHKPSPKVKVERFKHEIKVNQVQVADPIIEEPILEPEQTDRDGGKAVSGAVRVSEPQDFTVILRIGALLVFTKKVKLILITAGDSCFRFTLAIHL